ncbi:MAG: RNA polymerase sigma factor [Bacteroidota bacterium]
MDTHNDHELLNALLEGDEKGIEALYDLLAPKITKYITANNGTEDDAKDMLQKTMLQLALRKEANKLDVKSSIEAYAFTIARNLWRNYKKKSGEWVTEESQKTLLSKEAELIEDAIEQEKWDLFQEKLALLSENCQDLLRRVFDQQPYADIAKELFYASENVVRQRIFKCKKKLKEYVQRDVRYKELYDDK